MFHVPLRKLTSENNPLGKWIFKCRADGGKNMTSELRSALEFMVGPLRHLSVEETRKRKEQSDKLNHNNIHQSRVKAIC
jgi:hypothetical protein